MREDVIKELKINIFSALLIFQVEGRSHSIKRALVNGTRATVLVGSGSQPFDIAIDVIGRLLFWTCSHSNSINVTRYVMHKTLSENYYLISHVFQL